MTMRSVGRNGALVAFLGSTFLAGAADAAVVISSGATQNMSCSGGVCAPTAVDAVLNAGDLENLLASANVTVATTGSGVQAADIKVADSLAWSGASALSLDAYKSISVDTAVSVPGAGGMSLTTDDGGTKGTLSFADRGNITFASLSSSLTINGATFTLVGSVKSLAQAITQNPSGDYALAADYDATQDGTYSAAPIGTTFDGVFEGLGNTISNLSVVDSKIFDYVGLFAQVGNGVVENLALVKAKVVGAGEGSLGKGRMQWVGGVAGASNGIFSGDSVSGVVMGGKLAFVGGLVGLFGNESGAISNSHSTARVEGAKMAIVGGLVGLQYKGTTIVNSYSTGEVTVRGGHAKEQQEPALAGGLVGDTAGTIEGSFATGDVIGNKYSTLLGGFTAGSGGAEESGTISDCYSTGAVKGGVHSIVGGFVGESESGDGFGGPVARSYSTGAVSGGTASEVGGFAGRVTNTDEAKIDYWDTTSSGTDEGVGEGSAVGITGLTTTQLQSGLPKGFSPEIWGENALINNGLPYLLANPPPK